MKHILLVCIFALFTFTLQASEKMALIPGEGEISSFYMDIYEATRGEFLAFQKATVYKNLLNYPRHPLVYPKMPVGRVHWFEAQEFCQFHKKRLPTAQEWNLAAGTGKRDYPWGNEKPNGKNANMCDANCLTAWADPLMDDGHKRVAEVGSYPAGKSPEGVYDLAGNLWEWTSTNAKNGKPMAVRLAKDYTEEENNSKMIIKGGSFGSKAEQITGKTKATHYGSSRGTYVGFRCVKAANK